MDDEARQTNSKWESLGTKWSRNRQVVLPGKGLKLNLELEEPGTVVGAC